MDQGDQVIQATAPGFLAEQAERHLGDVDRGDRPALRRGQQRAAGRPAGQVGDRPGRQARASAAAASGCGRNVGMNPAPYLSFQRSRSGCPASSLSGSVTLRRLIPRPGQFSLASSARELGPAVRPERVQPGWGGA